MLRNMIDRVWAPLGNSWAAERLAASPDGLNSMELVVPTVEIYMENEPKSLTLGGLSDIYF
jgi:hypothetical protein